MLTHRFLAIFLLVFADCAWSQEPPKAPQIEPKQKSESGLNSQQNNTQQTQATPHPPPRIPEITPERANRKCQNKSDEGGEQGTEFWPPLYGYRLKVTDTLLVSITFFLFLATLALWLSTRSLVRGAEQTAERQLRAYVGISDHKLTNNFGENQKTLIELVITNFGQTPARELQYWKSCQFRPYPLINDLPVEPFQEHTIVLFPTDKITVCFEVGEFNAEEMADLASGDRRLYMHGHIRYKDVFGRTRNTWFRLIYGSAVPLRIGRMYWAEQGNEAD